MTGVAGTERIGEGERCGEDAERIGVGDDAEVEVGALGIVRMEVLIAGRTIEGEDAMVDGDAAELVVVVEEEVVLFGVVGEVGVESPEPDFESEREREVELELE